LELECQEKEESLSHTHFQDLTENQNQDTRKFNQLQHQHPAWFRQLLHRK